MVVTDVAYPVWGIARAAGIAGFVRYVRVVLFAGLAQSWRQPSCVPDLAGALCLCRDNRQGGGTDDEWGMTALIAYHFAG